MARIQWMEHVSNEKFQREMETKAHIHRIIKRDNVYDT